MFQVNLSDKFDSSVSFDFTVDESADLKVGSVRHCDICLPREKYVHLPRIAMELLGTSDGLVQVRDLSFPHMMKINGEGTQSWLLNTGRYAVSYGPYSFELIIKNG